MPTARRRWQSQKLAAWIVCTQASVDSFHSLTVPSEDADASSSAFLHSAMSLICSSARRKGDESGHRAVEHQPNCNRAEGANAPSRCALRTRRQMQGRPVSQPTGWECRCPLGQRGSQSNNHHGSTVCRKGAVQRTSEGRDHLRIAASRPAVYSVPACSSSWTALTAP